MNVRSWPKAATRRSWPSRGICGHSHGAVRNVFLRVPRAGRLWSCEPLIEGVIVIKDCTAQPRNLIGRSKLESAKALCIICDTELLYQVCERQQPMAKMTWDVLRIEHGGKTNDCFWPSCVSGGGRSVPPATRSSRAFRQQSNLSQVLCCTVSNTLFVLEVTRARARAPFNSTSVMQVKCQLMPP